MCYVGLETDINSLIRPALCGSCHRIYNLTRLDETPDMTAETVGPICETGNILGHARRLPHSTTEQDVLLFATAGAYGRVMSSTYNMRSPAAEIVTVPPEKRAAAGLAITGLCGMHSVSALAADRALCTTGLLLRQPF